MNFNLSVISVVSGTHMMVGLPWSRLIDPNYCIQSLIALGCAPLITWFTSRYILNKIFSEFGQHCTSENPHKDRPPVTRFEVLSLVVGLALGLSIQRVDGSLQPMGALINAKIRHTHTTCGRLDELRRSFIASPFRGAKPNRASASRVVLSAEHDTVDDQRTGHHCGYSDSG